MNPQTRREFSKLALLALPAAGLLGSLLPAALVFGGVDAGQHVACFHHIAFTRHDFCELTRHAGFDDGIVHRFDRT